MKINTFYNISIKKNYINQTNPIKNQADKKENRIEVMGYYYPHFNGLKQVVKEKISLVDITSKKQKLVKTLDDILATNKPVLSKEEIAAIMVKRTHNFMAHRRKKLESLRLQITGLKNDKISKPQERYNRGCRLMAELLSLKNQKPSFQLDEWLNQKPDENCDYELISLFKSAILNNEFDLKNVFIGYYMGLDTIKTIDELKEKYKGIKTPLTPIEVISAKISNTLNREFYENLEKSFQIKDSEESFLQMCRVLAPVLTEFSRNSKVNELEFVESFGAEISTNIFEKFLDIKAKFGDFKTIPKEINKKKIISMDEIDKKMLKIDFEKFVLSVIRQLYIEGKSLNDISYTENEVKIKLSELKNSDYKFEKVSEKIKKIIKDSLQIQETQRNYKLYNTNDFKNRLNYYAATHIGLNEAIYAKLSEFDSCRFVGEDIPNVTALLRELDRIQDRETDEETVIQKILDKNIAPHGTEKLKAQEEVETLKELEKEQAEALAKFKEEQEKALKLKFLRHDFDTAIQRLYEANLNSTAVICSKYYPNSLDENVIKNVYHIIKIVDDNIDSNKKNLANMILRKEIYQETLNEDGTSDIMQKALKFAENYPESDKEFNAGLYILSREIIEDYPNCLGIISEPEVVDKIMQKANENNDIAAKALSKYNLYKDLSADEKSSILVISKIFDRKNETENEVLEYIIKNDYINVDTVAKNLKGFSTPPTIGFEAKEAILDKYDFPNCLNYFISFEEALYQKARAKNSAGIKRLTGDITALYDYELKITGHTDRLFASKNDFRFDIYSPEGLH